MKHSGIFRSTFSEQSAKLSISHSNRNRYCLDSPHCPPPPLFIKLQWKLASRLLKCWGNKTLLNALVDPTDKVRCSDVNVDRVGAAAGERRSPRDDSDHLELKSMKSFENFVKADFTAMLTALEAPACTSGPPESLWKTKCWKFHFMRGLQRTRYKPKCWNPTGQCRGLTSATARDQTPRWQSHDTNPTEW